MNAWGESEKRNWGQGVGRKRIPFLHCHSPLPLIFVTSVPYPRVTPTHLKGNGKDCYAG